MSTRHEALLQAAKDAAENLNSDKSVSLLSTQDSLGELLDYVQTMYDAVTEDIERMERDAEEDEDGE